MLGVVGEEPQDHLQAAPAGAQQRGFRVGVDVAGGQFRGDGLAGRDGGGRRGAGAGDVLLQARDAGVLGGGGKARVGEQGGEAALGGGEGLLRVADGGVRLVAGGVADQLGVRLDAGQVVADLVYAVVLAGVPEEVLLPPPGLQPGQDVRRAGAEVRGQDLQGDPAVLEQGDLPGLAVVLELHRLLGPGDLPGPAGVGDGGDDGQRRGDGERGAPVGDPVHLLVAAVREDLRVGAAAVEADHDRRARAGGLLQFRQRFGQRDAEPGGLPGDETHRPPVVRGDVGVRAALLRPAALVVPAFRDRLGPGIGNEVVIDVVHAGGHRVRGQHRRGEHALQRHRVSTVGDPCQGRPQGAQAGQRAQPGQRPGLSGGQVLELLRCRGAEREAHADGRQQRHVPRLAAGRCQDRPGAGLREERVQQHRPRVPRPERPPGRQRPGRRPPARRQAGTRLRLSVSPGLRLALSPGPGNGTGTGLRPGFRLGEQGLRRRPPGLAARGRRLPARAQAAADRGIRHAEPPADLRVAGALLPPCPGLLPLRRGHLPRRAPAVLHGQGRRPVPLRRAVQRRDVRLRQAQRRGDRPAPEPQLPQHRQRDVPHHDVAGRVVEQDHRPGCDHAPAIVLVHAQVTGLWHALQDGRNRRWHATSLPLI